jgi:hypothetical protein
MATPTETEARAFSNVEDSAMFAEFGTFFDAALGAISHRCGPVGGTTFTEQTTARCGTFILDERPVQTLVSATDSDGNTVDITGAKISRRSAVVRLATSIYDELDVVYTAGWDPYPDDLEKAVYIVADHLWETQRGRSGSFTQIHGIDDDAPVGGDASYLILRGFALPRRAMELTRPYNKFGLA